MPYYRRPYKRARYGKKLKYSVQQKAVEFSTGSDDATAKIEVVPASEIEGMRKVKHLTVSCSAEVDTGSFYWALVYVPQGTTPGNITVNIVTGTGGMYEPNQFVMNCGVVDPSAGPIRFFLLLLLVISMTATPSTFSSATLTTRPLSLTTLLCVMLSPSSDPILFLAS